MKNLHIKYKIIVTPTSTLSYASKMHACSSSINTPIEDCNDECPKEKYFELKPSILKKN